MRVARCDSARDGRPVSGRGAGKRSVASGLVQLGALRATGVAPGEPRATQNVEMIEQL